MVRIKREQKDDFVNDYTTFVCSVEENSEASLFETDMACRTESKFKRQRRARKSLVSFFKFKLATVFSNISKQ